MVRSVMKFKRIQFPHFSAERSLLAGETNLGKQNCGIQGKVKSVPIYRLDKKVGL